MNTYGYVDGNPINYSDPYGLVNCAGKWGTSCGPGGINGWGAGGGGGAGTASSSGRTVGSGGSTSKAPSKLPGPKFPNLKDHAHRHSNLVPNAYYNQAVRHMQTGKPFKFRHNQQQKTCYITRTGPDSFTFTSTSRSGNTIFTHMEGVNMNYLKNLGITLPKGF